jgi:multicomponent Na+:H+ antiporter subunit A
VTALLLLHLVVGVAVVAAGQRLGRRGTLVGLVAPVATLAWLATKSSALLDGGTHVERVEWIPALGLGFDLRVDGFSALMILLVSGIGTLVFTYSSRYLPTTGPRVGRLAGLLVLFAGAMLGLVAADDLLVLYGFWELTSVTSFLLIGNDHAKPEARAAALQAFLVTGAGALAMLGGFLILGNAAGTYRISEIVADPPSGTAVGVALALILLGAFTKSAQYPFHSWLPGAMVAPTPVSAYLHSATMVKAGVYLVARLSPAFAVDISWWRPVVIGVGVTTMILGGLRALRQYDLKVLLAHGTVSQLGFLIAVFGIGTPEAMVAGSALLVAHAVFKATNFMVVGIVDHQFGTRDLRRLPRPDRSWTPTVIAAGVGAASMAGVPLAFGFIAKELDFEAIFDLRGALWPLAQVGMVFGALLTAGYSLRFAMGVLGRDATEPVAVRPADVRPHVLLVVPILVLTASTLVLGMVPSVADTFIKGAAEALELAAIDVHLAIWHGVGIELISTIIALAGGVALYLGRRQVKKVLAVGHRVPDGTHAYLAVLRGLNHVADRVTAVAQPGSLPIYAGVILTTAAIVPLVALSGGGAWPGWPDLVETPAHLPVAVMILSAALAASIVRRRFSAAVFLGVVGYAMAGLFVVQGAPDLAITQVAMETLSTVLFVLVLRRLPDRFAWAGEDDARPARADGQPHDSVMTGRTRMLRVLAALAVFGSVFVLAIVMAGPEPTTPASDEMIARSLPDGHGRNVVNVTLVDFRGFDTMGEITVLAAAAIGTVALARAGRRPGTPNEAAVSSSAPPPLQLGRLVVLDVSVRIVFAAVMVGSIYLLFAGHNQPGGGFVGGILAGAAVALRYLAGGIAEVRSISRARPWTVLGLGLLLAIGTAIVPLLLGDPVLSSAYRAFDVPLIGSVSLTSVLIFDFGVYLAVVGLALMMFESFGDDPIAETEEAPIVGADRPVSPGSAP